MKTKRLKCGCCGMRFETWDCYTDQGRGRGYGICRRCQDEESWREEAIFDECIKLLADEMSAEDRARFFELGRGFQKHFVIEAIQDGALKYQARGIK